MGFFVPHGKEGRAAQHEPIPIGRNAQPIEKPLVEIADQNQSHLLARRLRIVAQFLLQRGAWIALALLLLSLRLVVIG